MEKRALVLVVLTFLSCAAAVPAFAAGIEKGKASRTTLTLGGFVTTFPQIEVGTGSPIAPRDRLLQQFPTSSTSPVNRFDWSRWLGWIIVDV